jgi:heptosyltransferase-2
MIGDVLASTVICEAVKREWPGCEVHYMVYPGTVAVVENNPFVDNIIVFDPKLHKGFSALKKFGRSLGALRFEAVIDAYGKWESILPAYFSGAGVRVGNYKWYTAPFYTKTVYPAKDVAGSAVYHRLQLAAALTGKWTAIDFPEIYLTDVETTDARHKMSRLQKVPTIMISAMGSASNKSLPPAQMAAVLDRIAQTGKLQMLFNFMPNQETDAKAIYDLCQPETQAKIVFDFYTKGLREFLAVLSQCDALIGNEGGAVNMAKALRIPTYTIFSPWVNKSSWDMLADEARHVAVHLNDFYPEIYAGKHAKAFRKEASGLYKKLTPDLFEGSLRSFVKRIIS